MQDSREKRKFGGRTSGTWDAKWHLGKTKAVRIPLAISDEILEIARAIDNGQVDVAKNILSKISSNTRDEACVG